MNQIVTTEHLGAINAYIAEHSKYQGTLTSDGTDGGLGLKIDGVVEGSICMPKGGVVHIGPTGRVVGGDGVAIEADYIYVEGEVSGKQVARKGIELAPSATVRGEIEYHQGISTHNLAKVRASIQYAGRDE